jgi:tetratricopeptide (TPR) repeat protein
MKITSTDFYYDQDLREVPSNPIALREYVECLKVSLSSKVNTQEQVSLMGEVGTWLRMLGELDESEKYLRHALNLIQAEKLGEKWEIQQKIRLAHVYQYKKRFDLSNPLFAELLGILRNKPEKVHSGDIGYSLFRRHR